MGGETTVRRGEDAGREKARGLDALFRVHAPDAFRLAYLITGDRALAEDLTQDAFVKVVGRFHDIRDREAFWWYLRRTIVNLARSHFRHRSVERAYLRRQRQTNVQDPPDLGDRERLRGALLTLPPEQRAAVVLHVYEDLTEAETARILGRPLGTVKSMVSRGLERLRKELDDDE